MRRLDPWLAAAFVAAWLAALVPLWGVRFLPLHDLPNHLAGIGIWHRLDDPTWRYREFYEYSRVPIPYWGYYYPVHLLSYLLPVEWANRVYLSLYAAALPASLLLLGRRFGRSPWIALAAFPLLFNHSFAYGFFGYCGGLALALATLALLDRTLETPTARRTAALFLLALFTYFTHVLPWLLLGVCAVPSLVAARRRAVAPALALAATAVVALLNYRYAAAHGIYGVQPDPALAGMGPGFIERMRLVPHRLLMGIPGSADELTVAAFATTLLLLLATARARGAPALQRRDALPILWLAVAAAGYLLIPFHTHKPLDWWNINERLLTPSALFALLLVRGPIRGRFRLLLVPALVAALLHPVVLARRFAEYDARMSGLARLLARVPRGSSTITLALGAARDPAIDPLYTPYFTAHSWTQFLVGGYNPFQYRNGFPFRELRRLPGPSWARPHEFTPDMARHYDFVLTRNEARDGALLRDPAARPARDGDWRLYDVRAPW